MRKKTRGHNPVHFRVKYPPLLGMCITVADIQYGGGDACCRGEASLSTVADMQYTGITLWLPRWIFNTVVDGGCLEILNIA